MRNFILSITVSVLLLPISVFCQQFKPAPFSTVNSKLFEQIKAARVGDPKMSPEQLADAANAILQRNGLTFQVSFDSATCDKLKKARDAQKDRSAPLKLGAKLQSAGAEGVSLALESPHFADSDCGGCFIDLSLLEITDVDFVTIIQGQNIKFARPGNFIVNEATLLDPKDRSIIKRKWRLPFRSIPIGISNDENVLYLGFDEPELAGLSLAIFSEGVFQFATRTEAEASGKGILEAEPGVSDRRPRNMRFEQWGSIYIIRYSPPC